MPTTETPVFWIIWAGLALGAIVAVAIGLTAYGAMPDRKARYESVMNRQARGVARGEAKFNERNPDE